MTTATADHEVLEQVDRILHSEELRSSEVLRRLLKFLAEKTASGEGDDLKEYIVAIEGMGKPSSYDPRHDSAVRIQVGRLRQKLADYYRAEGLEDPIIIDIPKGRFKLHYELRPEHAPVLNSSHLTETNPSSMDRFDLAESNRASSRFAVPAILWALVAAVLTLAAFVGITSWKNPARNQVDLAGMTPELHDLWEPFLVSKRPLILAVEDPFFVEIQNGSGLYIRDKNVNSWKDLSKSPAIAAAHKALKNADIQPSRYYTSIGQVSTSFSIARLLGPHVQNFNIAQISELSAQQIADNNVIFVAIPPDDFAARIQVMPTPLELIPVDNGIRNLYPQPGEPELYENKYTTAPDEGGVAYALVTRLSGPLGNNDIESFTSRRAWGYVAAVKAFTDPDFARLVIEELKKQSGGRVPRYFQVLLKVKFDKGVPIQTDCVLTRELH